MKFYPNSNSDVFTRVVVTVKIFRKLVGILVAGFDSKWETLQGDLVKGIYW